MGRVLGKLLAIVVFACPIAPPTPSDAQVHTKILQWLDHAVKAAIAKIVEKEIDARWRTENSEIREIRADLARMSALIEKLANGSNQSARAHCSDQEPRVLVTCLIEAIRRARGEGKIDDIGAEHAALGVLEALGVPKASPPDSSGSRSLNPPASIPPVQGGTLSVLGSEGRSFGDGRSCVRTLYSDRSFVVGVMKNDKRDGIWLEFAGTERNKAKLVTYVNGNAVSSEEVTGIKQPGNPAKGLQPSIYFAKKDVRARGTGYGLNACHPSEFFVAFQLTAGLQL